MKLDVITFLLGVLPSFPSGMYHLCNIAVNFLAYLLKPSPRRYCVTVQSKGGPMSRHKNRRRKVHAFITDWECADVGWNKHQGLRRRRQGSWSRGASRIPTAVKRRRNQRVAMAELLTQEQKKVQHSRKNKNQELQRGRQKWPELQKREFKKPRQPDYQSRTSQYPHSSNGCLPCGSVRCKIGEVTRSVPLDRILPISPNTSTPCLCIVAARHVGWMIIQHSAEGG